MFDSDNDTMDMLLAGSFLEILQQYELPWNNGLHQQKSSPVTVLVAGSPIGLADKMNWGLGPTFKDSTNPTSTVIHSHTQPPSSVNKNIVTMYRAGVCLYENVTFTPNAFAALEPKGVPATVNFLAVDYYHGIIIVMHQGRIIHEESLTQLAKNKPN